MKEALRYLQNAREILKTAPVENKHLYGHKTCKGGNGYSVSRRSYGDR